jgi:anhydro-N-acetylmuramic acid kinase
MDSKEKYKVIGLMSGSSLDGVDVVGCTIRKRAGKWVFTINEAYTVQYSASWRKKLIAAPQMPGDELLALHNEYGNYLGVLVQAFLIKKKIRGIQFISSHGHTIFHQPQRKLTFQLGSGMAIHAASSLPVVCDFRNMDVALRGQGAPLVPVGDKLLFGEYDICLNIGGIANLSMDIKHRRIAFDICFANMGLNYLAQARGQPFDKNGSMASDGKVNEKLLSDLRNVYDRLRKKRPSLGHEMFVKLVQPLLDRRLIPVEDKLATFVESIAFEIAEAIPASRNRRSMLCTGGGAFNAFLMFRLVEICNDRVAIIIPDEDIVKFKEAVVFSFLGVLRMRNEINCLKSVTGALQDTSSGILIG